MTVKFKIKICGVTSAAAASQVASTAADALGLNFYSGSARNISIDTACEIASAVRGQLKLVGVFVNARTDEILNADQRVGLDYIQLHGGEIASQMNELGNQRIIRSCGIGADLDAVRLFMEEWINAGPPAAFLCDAVGPQHGGMGKTIRWPAVKQLVNEFSDVPILLAGGLNPTNVFRAINESGSYGVDTASGVESSPGVKDAKLVADFSAEAGRALGI